MSDIAFDTPAVGTGRPTIATVVGIADASIAEGDAAGVATMDLTLSRRLQHAATVEVMVP